MARRVYTKEFKAEAVKLITQEGYTARQASDSLGVSAHLINRWRRELEAINDSTLTEDDAAELKRLRKENKRLRLE